MQGVGNLTTSSPLGDASKWAGQSVTSHTLFTHHLLIILSILLFFFKCFYLFILQIFKKKTPLPLITIAVLYMIVSQCHSCVLSICPYVLSAVMKALTVSYDNSNTRGKKTHEGWNNENDFISSIDSFTFTLSNHLFLNILLHTQLQSMNIFVSLNVHKNIVEYITSKWHH